jgi:hypothetical protein
MKHGRPRGAAFPRPSMTPHDPRELKKTLVEWGFEVYRTLPDRVVLADRVRDNLIMDSGVSVIVAPSLALRVITRAQASDFPGESPEALGARARRQGSQARSVGYVEVDARAVPVTDPSDVSHLLDTWYEVGFVKSVDGIDALAGEIREALGFEKAARGLR